MFWLLNFNYDRGKPFVRVTLDFLKWEAELPKDGPSEARLFSPDTLRGGSERKEYDV
jgi:hypothetical protein